MGQRVNWHGGSQDGIPFPPHNVSQLTITYSPEQCMMLHAIYV